MPAFVWLIASGFAQDKEKFELATSLTRITFAYLLFISIASIFAGILNSLSKFVAAAIAPIILNLTLLGAMLFFAGDQVQSAYSLSWAVFAAGILQFAFLYYCATRYGYFILPKRPKIDAQTRTLFRRMIPVLIGAGVLQINVLVNTQIASYISDGAVSFLYYADRVSQLPLALIGTAMGVVLLPSLSKYLRDGQKEKSIKTQNQAIWVSTFLALPSAFGLALLSEDITRVLFERGNFGSTDTLQVAKALYAFAFGVPAFVLAKIFTPSFYAAEDTRTPVKIAVFCIALNIVISLSLIYIFEFDHLALAIATSASSWVNVILLCWFLKRKNLFHFNDEAIKKLIQIFVASAVMAFAVITLNSMVISTNPLVQLAAVIGGAGLVYFASALLLKTISIRTMLGRL
jgi:putative peptidoglycan lipid II flippase